MEPADSEQDFRFQQSIVLETENKVSNYEFLCSNNDSQKIEKQPLIAFDLPMAL